MIMNACDIYAHSGMETLTNQRQLIESSGKKCPETSRPQRYGRAAIRLTTPFSLLLIQVSFDQMAVHTVSQPKSCCIIASYVHTWTWTWTCNGDFSG